LQRSRDVLWECVCVCGRECVWEGACLEEGGGVVRAAGGDARLRGGGVVRGDASADGRERWLREKEGTQTTEEEGFESRPAAPRRRAFSSSAAATGLEGSTTFSYTCVAYARVLSTCGATRAWAHGRQERPCSENAPVGRPAGRACARAQRSACTAGTAAACARVDGARLRWLLAASARSVCASRAPRAFSSAAFSTTGARSDTRFASGVPYVRR
jgi:hypothetical protein